MSKRQGSRAYSQYILLWLLSGGGGAIGGKIPAIIEALLSWIICVFCLTVSGRVYVQTRITSTFQSSSASSSVPITTMSYQEVHSFTPLERHGQLMKRLKAILKKKDDDDKAFLLELSDDILVKTIRSDEVCRRLASLCMRQYPLAKSNESDTFYLKDFLFSKWVLMGLVSVIVAYIKSMIGHMSAYLILISSAYIISQSQKERKMTTLLKMYPELELPKRLESCWSKLLNLPSIGQYSGNVKDNSKGIISNSSNCIVFPYRISLVIPAYGEKGDELHSKLHKARISCDRPEEVEVVIVDAGNNDNIDIVCKESQHWAAFQIIRYRDGDGRGPALNMGARAASGQFLCFLHSDTTFPQSWDLAIRDTLSKESVTMCAFSFGIDTRSYPIPPGVRAVEVTANLRSHLYYLPYGDQVLTLPSTIFHFLGGYPYQCLMEDYELVALIRRRSFKMKQSEGLRIIKGFTSQCSPRRWQKLGVLKVTYTNSFLVNLYSKGVAPETLFRTYYGSKVQVKPSPWEKGIL